MPRRAARGMLAAALALALLGASVGCRKRPSAPPGATSAQDAEHQAKTRYARRLADRATRARVARELGRTKAVEAVEPLRAAARDPDPAIRAACLWALGEIGDPSAAVPLRFYLTDSDSSVRLAAVEALAKLRCPEAAEGLSEALKDPEQRIRLRAVHGLAAMGDDRSVQRIARALDDSEAEVRLTATQALVRLPGESANRALAKAMASPDPAVRSAAAAAFGRIRQAAAGRLREALISAKSLDARIDAARLLAKMQDSQAAATMLKLLENLPRRSDGKVAELRAIVVDALAAKGRHILGLLRREAMEGECGALAEEAAAEVCVRIGKPAAGPIAESILQWKLFPDPEELKLWVRTLGQIGDPRAAGALNRALAQDIVGIEDVVAEARRKIEAKSGPTLPALRPDHSLLVGKPGAEARRRIKVGQIALTPADPRASSLPDNGVVRLCLADALVRRGGARELEIELLRRDGKWGESVFGYSLRFNKRSHEGRLVEHHQGDKIALRVEMVVLKDYWVQGGLGEYDITVGFAQGRLVGTYRGRYNGGEVSGAVRGACWERPWRTPARPIVASGEYPRLLFRRHDLPLLRQRARTDLGRRILRVLRSKLAARKTLYRQRVNWVTTWEPGMDAAIGHGFLALLFEERGHGRRAADLMIERTRVPPYGGEHGERFPGPVSLFPIAYDLGHKCLEPHEREKIAALFRGFYHRFSIEWGAQGIFAVNRGVFPVPGMMALAVLRDKGPFNLRRPPAPRLVVTVSPGATLKEQEGVPTSRFEPGEMIGAWLMVGPFDLPAGGHDRSATDDPLASLGGCASARPQRGTAVAYRGRRLRFVPLPKEAVGQIRGALRKTEYIVIPAAGADSRTFLYSLLNVEGQQGCLIDRRSTMGDRWSAVWINGRRFENGTVAAFEPGLHRVLMEVRGTVASPTFPPVDAGAARAEHRRHQWLLQRWQAAKRRHEQTGELQDVPLILEMCRRGFRTSCLHEIDRMRSTGAGHGGGGLAFVSACWTATGEALLPDTPLLPAACPQVISSSRLRDRALCFALGLAPEKLKPALVREFNRRFLPDGLHRLSCMELVAAFVHYPLDVEPRGLP